MKFLNQKIKGFTIVETLVAVSMVLVAVTATFSAAQIGLSSNSEVRNRMTSTFLTQEAIEAVKNMKDSNLLDGAVDWLQGVSGPCFAEEACGYDVVLNEFFTCEDADDCEVYLENGLYRQSASGGGAGTGYIRKIFVAEAEDVNAGQEALVSVEFSKQGGSSSADFQAKTLIYNWF